MIRDDMNAFYAPVEQRDKLVDPQGGYCLAVRSKATIRKT